MLKPKEITMDETKIIKLVLEIGTLQIYSVQSASDYAKAMAPQYYYTDVKYLNEWKGPFHNIYNATEHYTKHLNAFKAAIKASTGKDYIEQTPKSNVVMVNFVTKQKHNLGNT